MLVIWPSLRGFSSVFDVVMSIDGLQEGVAWRCSFFDCSFPFFFPVNQSALMPSLSRRCLVVDVSLYPSIPRGNTSAAQMGSLSCADVTTFMVVQCQAGSRETIKSQLLPRKASRAGRRECLGWRPDDLEAFLFGLGYVLESKKPQTREQTKKRRKRDARSDRHCGRVCSE